MAKRNKRLLFDVIGSGDDGMSGDQTLRAAIRSHRGERKATVDTELRVTKSFAVVVGLVFVVFVLVSYYLGVHHGTRTATREDTGPRLRRDSGIQAEPEGEYAVKVRVESYTRYTFESLRKSLLAQAAFLEDRGYENVSALAQTDEESESSGQMTLWVGRATSLDALHELAGEIRSLSMGSEYVFEDAHAARFP